MQDKDIDQAYTDLRQTAMAPSDKVGNGYLEFNTLTGVLKKTVPLFKSLNTLANKTDTSLSALLDKDKVIFLGSIDGTQDWNTLPTTSGWYQVNDFTSGKNAPVGATTYGFLLYMVGDSANTQVQIYFPRVDPGNSKSIPRIRSTWSNPINWSAWSLLTQGYTKEEIDTKDKANTDLITSHTNNRNNPHGVTTEQIGTYNRTSIDAKDNRVQTNINNHISNKANPHEVTASQVGAMVSGSAYTKAEMDAKLNANKAEMDAKFKAVNDAKEDRINHWAQNGADGINGWIGDIQFERWGRMCTCTFNLRGGKHGGWTQMTNIPDWAVPSRDVKSDPWCVIQSSGGSGIHVGTVYISRGAKGLFTNNVLDNGNVLGTMTYITD